MYSSKTQEHRDKRWRVAALALAVVLAVGLAFGSAESGNGTPPPQSVPPIVLNQGSCPGASATAQSRAERLYDLGNSQRALWALGDKYGVVAAQLFQRSAECFATAGDGTRAERTKREVARLLAELRHAAQSRHLRLEYAQARGDVAAARREVGAQLRLFSSIQAGEGRDAYRRWLQRVELALRDRQRSMENHDG